MAGVVPEMSCEGFACEAVSGVSTRNPMLVDCKRVSICETGVGCNENFCFDGDPEFGVIENGVKGAEARLSVAGICSVVSSTDLLFFFFFFFCFFEAVALFSAFSAVSSLCCSDSSLSVLGDP